MTLSEGAETLDNHLQSDSSIVGGTLGSGRANL